MSLAVPVACFDASALVKRYVDEPGSDALRQYWGIPGTRYTTPFCLYETLGVLKRHKVSGKLPMDDYLRNATDLVHWFRASHSRLKDIDFTEPRIFSRARVVVEQFDLDLSDAFQLLSLEEGYFSGLKGESAPRLVTADEGLANAARELGVKVWNCKLEPMPER